MHATILENPGRLLLREASVVFALAGLCSCATLPSPAFSDKAARYRQQIIGTTKSVLLRCAGVPDKTFSEGHLTFFSYSYHHKQLQGGSLGYSGEHSFGISGFSGSAIDCVATIELDAGRVTNVTYRAPPSGPADLCSAILEPCFTGDFEIGKKDRLAGPVRNTDSSREARSAPPGRSVSTLPAEALYAKMRDAFAAGPERAQEFAYDIYLAEAARIENFILHSKGRTDPVKKEFVLQPSLTDEETRAIRWFMEVFSSFRVY